MMAGSKVICGAAAAIVFCEIPWAAASFLNCASQLSKLPVFWQEAASAGPAETAPRNVASAMAANFNAA